MRDQRSGALSREDTVVPVLVLEERKQKPHKRTRTYIRKSETSVSFNSGGEVLELIQTNIS